MPNRHGYTAIAVGAVSMVVGRVFGLVELYVLGIGVWLAVLWALASTRRRLPPMRVVRSASPTMVSVGEPARVDIQLQNRGRTRTPQLDLWEPVGARGGAPMQVASIRSGDSVRAAYRVPTARRGVIRLGPLRAKYTDALGLCSTTSVIAGADELLVVPRVVHLSPPRSGSAGTLGQHLKAKGWALGGREFHGLREYSDGDDPRSIHWRASARSTTLIVREAAPEGLSRCTVCLDSTDSEYDDDSWEMAVSAAASIVAAAHHAQLSTRLVCDSHDVRGPDVLRTGLEVLARVTTSPTAFEAAVASGSLDGLGLTVVVTGSAGSAAVGVLRKQLRNDETLIIVGTTARGGNGSAGQAGPFVIDGSTPESLADGWNRMAAGGSR
jgi:uncharacterized protein (DUF58 family)